MLMIWLHMTMVPQPLTLAMKDSILMVFPPELVEMVQELWDRGVAQHPAVMVSFLDSSKTNKMKFFSKLFSY